MNDVTKNGNPVTSGAAPAEQPALPYPAPAPSGAPHAEGPGHGSAGNGPRSDADPTRPRPESPRPDPAEMTFASRLPPDHPGLRLEKRQGRSLRRGPILVLGSMLALAVLIAAAVAFSPTERSRRAAQVPGRGKGPKGVTVPDTIQNAPSDNAHLASPPKLGPPLHGADLPHASPGRQQPTNPGAPLVSSTLKQKIREERDQARAASILVQIDGPAEATLPPDFGGMASSPAAGGKGDGTSRLPPVASSGAADPNLQEQKAEFLARQSSSTSTYLTESATAPRSAYEIKAGTIIPASLLTAINSDLPGQIIAQVRENVYDTVTGDILLVPQGSKLLAAYDSAVAYGQERVLFCWNRLVRPDGVSIALDCMPGADLSGASGAADDVDHHWWRVVTGVALGTLISATAERGAGNVAGYQPTVNQTWATNAGAAVNQAGQQITQKNLAIQPTITVRAGYSVNVIVTKDIVLPPCARTSSR